MIKFHNIREGIQSNPYVFYLYFFILKYTFKIQIANDINYDYTMYISGAKPESTRDCFSQYVKGLSLFFVVNLIRITSH